MSVLYISLLTVFASGIGTLTGFGTSTVMVPVLLLFLPLPQTLLIVGIIHWFGDVWKMLLFRKGFRIKLILAFGIAGIVTTYAGANIVFSVSEQWLSRFLGAFLVSYVVFIFLKPSFKIPQKTLTAVIGGALSGFFAGIFGVGGAVRSAFLTSFDLPKAIYIATTGAIAFIIDSTRITTYLLNGVTLEGWILKGFLFFIPASLIGASAAKRVLDRVPQEKFRLIVGIFLLLIGLKFLFLET